MSSDLRYTESTERKCRRLALARANKCRTCRSSDPIGREASCIGCGTPTSSWTCVPGYCRVCSHDPRWLKVGAGDARVAAGRRADQ